MRNPLPNEVYPWEDRFRELKARVPRPRECLHLSAAARARAVTRFGARVDKEVSRLLMAGMRRGPDKPRMSLWLSVHNFDRYDQARFELWDPPSPVNVRRLLRKLHTKKGSETWAANVVNLTLTGTPMAHAALQNLGSGHTVKPWIQVWGLLCHFGYKPPQTPAPQKDSPWAQPVDLKNCITLVGQYCGKNSLECHQLWAKRVARMLSVE